MRSPCIITPSSSTHTTVSNIDKYYTVPANTEWRINNVQADFTTSAVVGNRRLMLRITDGLNNNFTVVIPGLVNHTASTPIYYTFGSTLPDLVATRATNYMETPLPTLILPSGCRIRVSELASIDAAGDSLTIRLIIAQRSI